jgi:hypothetical protein
VDPLVATLFLILLALLGARVSFSTRRVPAGYQLLLRTGTHFLFVGFFLGPAVLGLLTTAALDQLSPLLGLALGWIGLLFGLQLDRSTLKQFPRVFVSLALGQALLTFALFAMAGFLVADLVGVGSAVTTLAILGAAATASVTTPAGIAMVSANFMARGNVRELLYFVASLDAVVGITALHVAYASMHGTSAMVAGGGGTVWIWLLSGPVLAAVCAFAFLWVARLRPSREELVLYLLGISALSAGAALQLQISPLFVGLVAGAIISNLDPQWHRIFRLMESWEKPIYVVLLILAGAFLRFATWWVVPLTLGYVVIRAAAKVVSTAVLVNTLPLPFRAPRRLGLGLVPQGGISIAMALSLVLTMGGTDPTLAGLNVGELLFATVILGVVVSELVGPLFTTAVLRAAGEISPTVGEVPPRGEGDGAHAGVPSAAGEGLDSKEDGPA